jgi:hypothetical protein
MYNTRRKFEYSSEDSIQSYELQVVMTATHAETVGTVAEKASDLHRSVRLSERPRS